MSGANTNCPSPAKEVRRISPWVGGTVALVSRYLLGVVFLMAAVSKIVDVRDFENHVLLHSPLPGALAKVFPSGNISLSFSITRICVLILPWLELTCGLCLILGRAVRESASIIALLLSLFIAQALVFRSEDCHCFFFPSFAPSFPWWWQPVRDTLLLSCSLYLACKAIPKKSETR
jgi:uncharacterized membrane protein YphA (DoxX/SURF4 family)